MRLALVLQSLVLCLARLQALYELAVLIPRVDLLGLARAQLVLEDLHLILETSEGALDIHVVQTNPHKLPFGLLDALLYLPVLSFHLFVELLPLLHLLLLLALSVEVLCILLTQPLQLVVSGLHAFHSLLPLRDELLPVFMQLSKQLGSLIHLYLPRLRLCDLVCQLLALAVILHSQLFNGQRQLADLRVIGTAVLLKCELVLLLLPGSYGPLLQLFLVPVQLQLVLVELLVASHELIRVAVDLVLRIVLQLLKADDLGLQAAQLPAGQRLHVLLCLSLVLLGVDQLLRVHQLLLHVDEVVRHDLDALTIRLELLLHTLELRLFALDLRIELLVLF
mmetsp:Transcript_36979/g.102768  ORF Transcript_36979/g.102768 Transcript_36979/m.102768 type:complete len:336 (+) Transcript_36979:1838-2845(+)